MKKSPIILRKTTVKDTPFLMKWFNDRENIRFMSPLIRARRHTLRSIKKEIRSIDPEYERLFTIYQRGEKTPIGHAGIDDLSLIDRRGEIYYLIGDKDQQGKGYGKIIVAELLNYAFNRLHLNSIAATTVIKNKASMHILKKAGFQKVGVYRMYNCINGKFVDEVIYDLIASDYRRKVNGRPR